MNVAKKFTVLFMHDNGKTYRFRLGSKTVVFSIVCTIAFPILIVFLGWTTYSLFTENQGIHAQLVKQEKELVFAVSEKNRLSNLEEYLIHSNVTSINNVLAQNTKENEQAVASLSSQEEAQNTTTPAPLVSQAPVLQEESINMEDLNAAQEALELPEDTAVTGVLMNTGLLRLENIKAKLLTDNRISLSFDIFNSGQQNQISGDCNFFLIQSDENDKEIEIPLKKRENTSFRINKLKKMSVSLSDAQGEKTQIGKNDKLRIDIVMNNETTYSILVPLES